MGTEINKSNIDHTQSAGAKVETPKVAGFAGRTFGVSAGSKSFSQKEVRSALDGQPAPVPTDDQIKN